MDIGEKIKQVRLEKNLSQRQLCGQTITRNMLSLIESGKARPGMDTLRYLASRLEKPVSFFLEETAVTSPNEGYMTACRKAYTEGRPLPEGYRPPDETFDPEYYLLQLLSCTDRAEKALQEGKAVYAESLLQQAQQAAEKTIYDTESQKLRRQYLQSLLSPKEPIPKALEAAGEALLLHRAQQAYGQKEYSRCITLLDAMATHTPRWHYLQGAANTALGAYETATQHLHRAEEAYPGDCIPLLEICYRELGDYQKAYHYARAVPGDKACTVPI